MSKLTPVHLVIIGIVTALVLSAVLFFVLIKPKNEDIETTTKRADSVEADGGTPDKVAAKKKEYEKTDQNAQLTEAKWQVNSRKYMPDLNLGTTDTLLNTYIDRIVKIPTEFGLFLNGWYDSQRNLGVARVPGVEFPIDSFPTDPNQISSLTHIKFPKDKWTVQLEGKSFDALMAHLGRFNDMRKHGMPVINNVALEGQSPNLYMSYDLALYVIPSKAPPANDPRLTGGAGAAPGGAGGGLPTSMGGMSMGMSGGMGGRRGAKGGAE